MSSAKQHIDFQSLPRHIAIIMDGNGRWARKKGGARIFGHKSAIKAVRDTIEACAELGVEFLTLYAFSTENWRRPRLEVKALMELLVDTITAETPTLQENEIQLRAIGTIDDLPNSCRKSLLKAIQNTKDNKRMTLTLALSYGGRSEIMKAVKEIGKKIAEGSLQPDEIDEELIKSHMTTDFLPDPELMIRTSGEFRISNFLLWEIAYSELYITQKLWPDFRREDLYSAIVDYQQRERRFGKTSEQIKAS